MAQKPLTLTLLIMSLLCISQVNAADAWREFSERTRSTVYRMENRINLVPTDQAGRKKAYEAYMATFSPNAVIHGLVPSGDVDYQGLRRFYAALFGTFRDSVLVSDELIVAGDMAAQRYHSLGRMSGEFDGVKLDNRMVALRGQTFFRLGKDDRIIERWSNHDHGYRMALTRGPDGSEIGKHLALHLNGPGLTEAEVYEKLTSYADAFNVIYAPEERERRMMALFAPDAHAHGIGVQDADLHALLNYFRELWTAMPDLILKHDAMLSAWSMGATRWSATGSRRGARSGQPVDWQPVQLRGEMIVRYDGSGLITEIWLNEQASIPLELHAGAAD